MSWSPTSSTNEIGCCNCATYIEDYFCQTRAQAETSAQLWSDKVVSWGHVVALFSIANVISGVLHFCKLPYYLLNLLILS